MRHGSLFSGIGGFDLAAEWIGWENVFHCELNEFGQNVLKYYWPNATSYADIKKTDFSIHRGAIDILSGGFPCQPYSHAGKRKGTEDERHLWPEMLRAIRQIQPDWVVGENVRGLINWNGGLVFDQVQAELEAEGYEVFPFLLPAAGVNSPHERYRIWFVAHATGGGQSGRRRWCKGSNGNEDNKTIWTNIFSEIKGCCSERFTPDANEFNGDLSGFRAGEVSQHETYGIFKNTSSNTGCEHSTVSVQQRGQNTAQDTNIDRSSKSGFDTNADGIGLRGQGNRFRKPGQFSKDGPGNYWQDFPTQSPVCDGDDGFSIDLLRQRIRDDSDGYLTEKEIDKIISKAHTGWRNESIKAGGNAIVPQVVYQIFKTIEQYILKAA